MPSGDATDTLRAVDLFEQLPDPILADLARAMDIVAVPSGDVLIRQGELSDSLYVVASGSLRLSMKGPHEAWIGECGPGEIVGEVAFLMGQPRSATVVARTDASVLRLSRRSYDEIARKHPSIVASLTDALAARLRRSQLGLALRGNQFFGALDELVLRDIEGALEPISMKSGQILFRQGEAGDALYLVVGGRVRVVVTEESGHERIVAELGKHEIVGEMALLGGKSRTATVYAVRDTNLARLPSAAFDDLASRHHRALLPLMTRLILIRVQDQMLRVVRPAQPLSTVAVVPISPGVELGEFCDRLRASLAKFGRALHLDREAFNALTARPDAADIGDDDPFNDALIERLATLEQDHDYIIFQTDSSLSAWTRRSVRQADQILLVAAADAPSSAGEFEQQIRAATPELRRPRTSLVLLHSSLERPTGTARWLDARDLDDHYHIRLSLDLDIDRLARLLAGRAIGLVLGGGFARGIGHVGVLRALEELSIPVDYVGGTSVGAAIAVAHAYGFSPDHTAKITCDLFMDSLRHGRTLPIVSFLRGDRAVGPMRAVFGNRDVDLEDLWLPCVLVSANLTRGEPYVHRRGSVIKGILSSCRAPVFYPPVVANGDLLVDGAIVDNVPVEIMKEFSRGAEVIAVDVSPGVDATMTADYGLGVSGWRTLWDRVNPFAKERPKVPNLFNILLRTIEFAGIARRRTARQIADVYLQPPVERFRQTDFPLGAEIAEVAYRDALPRLKAWKEDAVRFRVPADERTAATSHTA
ncbi:MAG: cyclic nucleotide-binding domain-containing protein [Betaproteobacteria bacterium]